MSVTVLSPSTLALSGSVRSKETAGCPAGMTTPAGTSSEAGSLDSSATRRLVGKMPESDTTPKPGWRPAPSAYHGLSESTLRLVVSLSVTSTVASPAVQLVTVAVRVTDCGPSISASSTTVRWNTAEVCPAGIVTPPGTCSSSGAFETNRTSTLVATGALTVIVATTGPLPSIRLAGATTLSVAVSLSWTETARTAGANPGASAVIPDVCVPSSSASSITVRSKKTFVLPAGTSTVAGTITSEESLAVSATRRLVPSGKGSTTRPALVTVPSPSVSAAICEMASGAAHGPWPLKSLASKPAGTPSPADRPTSPRAASICKQVTRRRPSKNISIWKLLVFASINSGTF